MKRKSFRVPDSLVVLLDQNIPCEISEWLQNLRPNWTIHHTAEVGLSGESDHRIFTWAQQHQALVLTFDEDFADQRSFPVGNHSGIVRLRIWPTTIEETQRAIDRLLKEVTDRELSRALVIVDRTHIRIRGGESVNLT